MTKKSFCCDLIRKFFITLILYGVIIPLVLWLIAISGKAVVLALTGGTICLVAVFSLLVPTVIQPMFNKFKDLEPGELRNLIESHSTACHVDIAEIKVIDGSKRSNHSNAYVMGWGSFRKVVLFDTLIA